MAQPSMSVETTEVREEHIDGCNATLDVVARERKHLSFLEAPPIKASRAFIGMSIAQRLRISWRWRAIGWSAGVMSRPESARPPGISAFSVSGSCRTGVDRASAGG
jgi:hypothetical protein